MITADTNVSEGVEWASLPQPWMRANVQDESLPDIAVTLPIVRFTPESGHR